jgi:replication factor C large subunit
MLIEKYKPKSLSEVVGQKSLIESIVQWLGNWKPKKALLLYGPTGIGKTLIPELIAKENKFNLVEISASDDNLTSYVRDVLVPASKESSLFNKRLIMIDDLETIKDRGVVAEIINLVKESSTPIIITSNNAYDEKLRTLRNYCVLVKANRVSSISIGKYLSMIVAKEGIHVGDEMVARIAKDSDGDIRSAINDLEAIGKNPEFGLRDRERDIFKTLKSIFQSGSLSEALQAMDESDKDVDDIFWWVEQNIALEFKSNEEFLQALELLSKADMFRNKIVVNQNYRFKKYMKETLAGITLIGKNKGFIMYRPPDRLMILGRTKISRAKDDETYTNLGGMLHCSKRKVKEQMPYLNVILKKYDSQPIEK